jgi:RimJ/RimL family protein N-acetyltransferase
MRTLTAPVVEFATETPRGVFVLRLASVVDDLELVHRWMHAEHVVPYWQQAWPVARIENYLVDQLRGVAYRPCLGLLAGMPISYWEVYRPLRDPVGETYDCDPEDIGIHLLIGEPGLTGRGLGAMLLEAVATSLFRHNTACRRIVAEPDVRNAASIKAFSRAGFVRQADVELPGKTAALMVRSR